MLLEQLAWLIRRRGVAATSSAIPTAPAVRPRAAFHPTPTFTAANVMSSLRRFETSLKRRKCANSGHSSAQGRMGASTAIRTGGQMGQPWSI